MDYPGENSYNQRIGRIYGRVAQLGERFVRNEEVAGSIPVTSTSLPASVVDEAGSLLTHRVIAAVLASLLLGAAVPACAWTFAVSGDSRNCGDVVMPAIARRAKLKKAAFYWHLGDLRKIVEADEDMEQRLGAAPFESTGAYQAAAWDDFAERQVKPFAPLPFYLGIGNHETVAPKTRAEFSARFAALLNAPALRAQRLRDDPKDAPPRTYFHWRERGVEFVYLDNASDEEFDDAQLAWFDGVLARALADPSAPTLVVGMHEALPHSISADHSMDQSSRGVVTGERVYHALLAAQARGKKVYVLASHSHFFMDGIFNTAYWRANGGVLPGWIVGTAGAFRYTLPPGASDAREAREAVYGAMFGRVKSDGSVAFEFAQLSERDVPAATAARFAPGFVHWCFAENRAGAPGAKPW